MTRRGFVFPLLVLAAGAAGVLALVIIASAAHRARMAQQHQQRIQGREWCLGAQQLPDGTVFVQGKWHISVDKALGVQARGPLGTYRIALDGREEWSHRQ